MELGKVLDFDEESLELFGLPHMIRCKMHILWGGQKILKMHCLEAEKFDSKMDPERIYWNLLSAFVIF